MRHRIRDWWLRTVGSKEGQAALQRAHQNLEEAKSGQPVARGVAKDLRDDGVVNHFAELIRASMRGA